MWTALSLIVMSAVAYSFNEFIVNLVLAPIGSQKLVYLTPAGGFAFIFQIIIYAGVLLTAPVAVYHIYKFIAPALPEHLRGKSIRIVALSTLLMAIGAAFGYFIAVPAALQFLMAFAGNFVEANLTADSYLNFVVAYVLGLGLLFQLPLLLQLWNGISRIPPGGLWKSQEYVLVGSFVAAALITPTPDVFNQALIALPIIAVYQIGVLSVYLTNKKSRTRVNPKHPTVKRDVSHATRQPEPQKTLRVAQQAATVSVQPVSPSRRRHPVATVDGFVIRGSGRVSPGSRPVQPRANTPARPAAYDRPARPIASRPVSIDGLSYI